MPFWNRFIHVYDGWDAKRNGIRDGKKGIPEADELPDYLSHELKGVGDRDIGTIAKRFLAINARLQQEFEGREKYVHTTKHELDEAYHQLEERKAEYRRTYDAEAHEGLRSPLLGYVVFMLVLILVEVVFNASAFQTANIPGAFTYVMGGFVALGLVVCAHFLGVRLKKDPFKTPRESALTVIIGIVFPAVAIFGVNWIREKYLSETGGTDASAFLGPLVVINLMVYFAAVVASYIVHEPVRDAYIFAVRKLRDCRANYDRACAGLTEIRNRRKDVFLIHKEEASQIANIVENLTGVYAKWNALTRSEKLRSKITAPQLEFGVFDYPEEDRPWEGEQRADSPDEYQPPKRLRKA